MRIVQPLKKQSAASYVIEQKRAARDAGQDRPRTRDLLQQYKSMNAAPVKEAPVRDIGTGNPVFRPKDIASTTQSPNNPGPIRTPAGTRGTLNNDAFGGPTSGPGAPLPSNTPNPAIIPKPPMGADYNAGTLSPRGGVTGGARPAPPMGGGMKKGGSVRAEKTASGGMTSKAPAASKRGDGIAQRGKTKGRMV
jgi:hypothetical protein